MQKVRRQAGPVVASVMVSLGALLVGAPGCGDDDDRALTAVDASTSDGTTASDAADPGDGASPTGAGVLRVLSNRADLVSGGDALVQLVPAADVDVTKLVLTLGSTDVTSAFAVRADGRFIGLVTGLAVGPNQLTAALASGRSSSLTITNHPLSGPILYGPQIQPWGCDADAGDADCNRPVSYAFAYVSTDPAKTGFLPYDPTSPPSDIATTTTDQGTAVPFVVRIETGVQDRDYYDVAVLFDPTKPWSRWTPQSGWNGKLVIQHGGGCGNGYAQAQLGALSTQRVLDQYGLSRGFASLAISLNDAGHNCNLAVEAEATMMAKEHVVEAYGDVRHTFGYGTSGGALAEQWISNAYPGLYDGIIAGSNFPDAESTMVEVEDCALLLGYFGRSATSWSDAEQAAASGHLNTGVCNQWTNLYSFQNNYNPVAGITLTFPGLASPTFSGGCDAPAAARYNAVTNPTGVRCDLQDSAISIFGKRPDGFAGRPYANIGVQYGLAALQAGMISLAQFIDLNANIGSHDIDYTFQPGRVAADPSAILGAYRSGSFNEGNGMANVAMIHIRSLDVSGIHHQYRSWAMRARLDRANGGHGNQAIWYVPTALIDAATVDESYDVMDAWLSALDADKSGGTLPQKIIADRPARANDRCGSSDGTGLTMVQCTGAADGSTRMAAGEDISDDILDCQLAPLNRASYGPAPPTDAQWATLQATFPGGVCNYAVPGNGQHATQVWQSYLQPDGTVVAGGYPLPPAP